MSWNSKGGRPGDPGFRGNQHVRHGSCIFSEEDDAFILKHYKKPGWTTRKIAAHLGHKRNSVVSRYHILQGRKKRGGIYYYHNRSRSGNTLMPKAQPTGNVPSMPKLKFLGDDV